MSELHEYFPWRQCILSQYDKSPKILTLAEGLGKLFSLDRDIDNFYDKVFNIGNYYLGSENSNITKNGLDIWSNIVACKTLFDTSQPVDGSYDHVIGFDDATAKTMTVTCTLSGTAGTVIPAGSHIKYGDGVSYISATDATIGADGTTIGKFSYSGNTATTSLPSGTTMTMLTIISGWDSCVTVGDGSSTSLGNFDNNVETYESNNGGTFARESMHGTTIELSGGAARRLILLKAMFNIMAPTLPNMNKWIKMFFSPYVSSGYGAMITHTGTMQVTLSTNFKLDRYFRALIIDSGTLPIPAGVELVINDTSRRLMIHDSVSGEDYTSSMYEETIRSSSDADFTIEANTQLDPSCVAVTTLEDVPTNFFSGGIILLQEAENNNGDS